MSEHRQALDLALEAALTGGAILRERRSQTREVSFKGRRDIVTDADFASDRAIHDLIHRRFPDHLILSEEDPNREASISRAENLWIIDPLDGTTNYSRDYPVYTVSVALAQHGRRVVGVVYDPARDECFQAVRGEGAFLNGERIRASTTTQMEDALIGFELPPQPTLRRRGLSWFARLAAQSMTGRIGGSAALSFCYVAAGRLDAYFHPFLNVWDVAAGMLIAGEAGGRVTDLAGRPANLNTVAFLAASKRFYPTIYQAISRLIQ